VHPSVVHKPGAGQQYLDQQAESIIDQFNALSGDESGISPAVQALIGEDEGPDSESGYDPQTMKGASGSKFPSHLVREGDCHPLVLCPGDKQLGEYHPLQLVSVSEHVEAWDGTRGKLVSQKEGPDSDVG